MGDVGWNFAERRLEGIGRLVCSYIWRGVWQGQEPTGLLEFVGDDATDEMGLRGVQRLHQSVKLVLHMERPSNHWWVLK